MSVLNERNTNIYNNLWIRNTTCEHPVSARYWQFSWMRDGQAAYFALFEGEKPFPHIRIGRERGRVPPKALYPDPEGATIRELISLAHERGHEESWRQNTYTVRSMLEEHRAWDLAEKMLLEPALGFEDWKEFKEAKQESLDGHRKSGTPDNEGLQIPYPLPTCSRCGADLLFSVWQRGDGVCGVACRS